MAKKPTCGHCGMEIDAKDPFHFYCKFCTGTTRKKRPDDITTGTLAQKPYRLNSRVIQRMIDRGVVKCEYTSNQSHTPIFTKEQVEYIKEHYKEYLNV